MPRKSVRQSYQSRVYYNWKTQEVEMLNILANKQAKERKKNNHQVAQKAQQR
jgi:hypothetical protein